jgi:Cof subfamily protein (haloacid dehalogenase superfamily)
MYRLLAIDLDDTLLSPQRTITRFTLQTLRRVMATGITLVIATGRVPYMLPAALEDLPPTTPIIAGNGALIIDRVADSILYEKLFPQEHIQKAFAAIRAADLQWCFYARDRMYIDRSLYGGRPRQRTNFPLQAADDEKALYAHPCIKLAARGNPTTLKEKRRQLEEQFAGQCYITQTGSEWLELLHPEVSKANALQFFTERMGIKAEEVIAFGDNFNDIEMLRFAGLSIAMGNAEPEVQAVANHITKSNAEDGIALALEKFLL